MTFDPARAVAIFDLDDVLILDVAVSRYVDFHRARGSLDARTLEVARVTREWARAAMSRSERSERPSGAGMFRAERSDGVGARMLTTREAAVRLGRPRQTVNRWARELGLDRLHAGARVFTEDDVERMEERRDGERKDAGPGS